MDCSLPGYRDSPGKNTGVGSRPLLQGIFPTQRWNRNWQVGSLPLPPPDEDTVLNYPEVASGKKEIRQQKQREESHVMWE